MKACRLALIALVAVAFPNVPFATAEPDRYQTDDIDALNQQFVQLAQAGNVAEAIAVGLRAMALAEQRFGPEDRSVANFCRSLASLYVMQGQFADAERLLQRSLSILEKSRAPDLWTIGPALNELAQVYRGQGRDAEAEPLLKRSLEILENIVGPEDVEVSVVLNNLAALYDALGKADEAEPLLKRSLAIAEKAFGAEHPQIALSLNNLALIYASLNRLSDAEALYLRSLSISEKALGPEHPLVGNSLSNLSDIYRMQGRYDQAEEMSKRALSLAEKALGPEHPDLARYLNNLAVVYRLSGRFAEAEALYQRSLSIAEKAEGPDAPNGITALNNLATLHFAQKHWAAALHLWERSAGLLIRRTLRGGEVLSQGQRNKDQGQILRLRSASMSLIKASYRLSASNTETVTSLSPAVFEYAQWAQASDAAASLAQMTARHAKAGTALATLVRERQDLVAEWHERDTQLIASISQSPDSRDVERERLLRARLASVDGRVAEIDKTLVRDFPDYAALTNPEPLSIQDTQAQLGTDEALVLILDTPEFEPTPEETFIWVVTRTASRWVRSGLGTGALIERVSAFRCGLDSTNWTDASKWPEASEDAKRAKDEQVARRERCKALTGTNVSDRAPPPFDVAKSHELYQALFGQVEDLIKNPDGTGKHLLVVPSGPLTQLPFQVLVTDKPRPGNSTDYARTAWLAKRHAITVLPSVASLKALRQNAKGSKAARPFVGFGNPLLVGLDGSDKSAFTRQACPKQAVKPEPIVVAGRKLPKRFARLVRGGVADVAALKHQAPLPETADELCAVARQLGADEREVNLGARATETRVKQLNGEGALGQARVLHFATHGLIASETESVAKSLAEPALLLTPPDSATATDDGLLTASEVTELKLDADWVVLSACNTAAAGEDGSAEALSGLARAFFFAGARALLVSHWYVDSRAAVQITTTAFAELKRDPKIGRAEALRRAMLAVMNDRGRPRSLTPAAHPAVWAPFVVVGEGGGTTADSTSAMITGTKTQSPATASVPDATSSLQPVEVVPEPKAKGKAARRRKPTSEWDWFYDLW